MHIFSPCENCQNDMLTEEILNTLLNFKKIKKYIYTYICAHVYGERERELKVK